MPKSRNRKNHKKKVKARNNKIQSEKRRAYKMQREMLEKIMLEAQQGQFENNESVPDVEGSATNDNNDVIGDIELEL